MTDLYREHDDVDHRFAFHPATSGEKRAEHDSFRGLCREFAHELVDRLPAGRERATALTNLEQVMFWGNAAIARALPADAPERTGAEPARDQPRHPADALRALAQTPARQPIEPVDDWVDLVTDSEVIRDLAAS